MRNRVWSSSIARHLTRRRHGMAKAYRHRNDTASSHSIDSSMRAGPACCRDHACAFAMIFPAIFIRPPPPPSPFSCPTVRWRALPFPARYSRPSLTVCLSCYCVPRSTLSRVSVARAPSSVLLLREGFDESLILVSRFRQFIALVIYVVLIEL